MIKGFFIVGIGSFLGGGMRYLVSCLASALFATTFPLGTFLVNVIGCFVIGFLYGLDWGTSTASSTTKLLLTTGFCGGFTTFSTFMNETSSLIHEAPMMSMAYVVASLAVGMVMLMLGSMAARAL